MNEWTEDGAGGWEREVEAADGKLLLMVTPTHDGFGGQIIADPHNPEPEAHDPDEDDWFFELPDAYETPEQAKAALEDAIGRAADLDT